jgi:hypothetical protein
MNNKQTKQNLVNTCNYIDYNIIFASENNKKYDVE